jgi:hypothetical protein
MPKRVPLDDGAFTQNRVHSGSARKNKNAKSEKCEIGKMDRQKTAVRNPGPPFDKDRVPINKGDRDH